MPRPAQAAFTFTVFEQGSDVVVAGAGTLNLAALRPFIPLDPFTQIEPSAGGIATGGPAVYTYFGIRGPTSFGPGGVTSTTIRSGNSVAIGGEAGVLAVEVTYQSGEELVTGMTFLASTLESIGATPGSYVWTWGSGATEDSLTVRIVVPEPVSAALLGAGLLGLAAVLRGCRDRTPSAA